MKSIAPKRYGSTASRTWLVQFDASDFPRRGAIELQVDAFGYLLGENYAGMSASIFLAAAATCSKEHMLTFLGKHEVAVEGPTAELRQLAAVGERFGFDGKKWRLFARQVYLQCRNLNPSDRLYYAAYLYIALGEQRVVYGRDLINVIVELERAKRSPIVTKAQVDVIVSCSYRLTVLDKVAFEPKLVADLLTHFLPSEIGELLAEGLDGHKLGRAAAIRGELGHDAPVAELIEMVTTMRDSWFANLLAEV